MRWFVLKDRRYEGPYTREEIQSELNESRISGHDFIISEENRKENPLAFEKVSDLLGKEAIQATEKQSEAPVAAPVSSAKSEELSKEFEEAFDSKDLIKDKEQNLQGISYEKSAEEIFIEESKKGAFWGWVRRQRSALVVVGCVLFIAASFVLLFMAGEKQSKLQVDRAETKQNSKPVFQKAPPKRVLSKQKSAPKLPQIQRRAVEEFDPSTRDISGISENPSFRRSERVERRRRDREIAEERSLVDEQRDRDPYQDDYGSGALEEELENRYDDDYTDGDPSDYDDYEEEDDYFDEDEYYEDDDDEYYD